MRVLATLSVVVALALADQATAAEVMAHDRHGRPIHLDVRADGVKAGWYANLLRKAAHADEISRLTVRIVAWSELRRTCGNSAAGCYSRRAGRGLLVVPASRSRAVAHTLVHEYGHHVDAERSHRGGREANGTPLWWRARRMATLVKGGSVAHGYRLGWEHSIGEIFAEDYAYLNVGGPYRIGWLRPPDAAVRTAIQADLGLASAGLASPATAPPRTALPAVVITGRGTLVPSAFKSVPFRLLGSSRMATFTATLVGPARDGASGWLAVACASTVRVRTLTGDRRSATLELRGIGPARCYAMLANTSGSTERFRYTLRLTAAG